MSLKKNNPGCGCCAPSTPPVVAPCTNCIGGTQPATVSVTISGMGDGICTCSFWNATHICPQTTGNACVYRLEDFGPACSSSTGGTVTFNVAVTFSVASGPIMQGGEIISSSTGITRLNLFSYQSLESAPFDCGSTRGYTFSSNSGTLCSNYSGLTVSSA